MARKSSTKKKKMISVVGTPTMMLLPARNYKFDVDSTEHVLTVPRTGKYVDLDKDLYTEKDGEFDLLAVVGEEDIDSVLYVPALTKVLFGVSKYPDLDENQAFTIVAIVVRGDEVDIVGQVINMTQEVLK